MVTDHGGESSLAPVIPLFARTGSQGDDRPYPERSVPHERWRSTWDDDEGDYDDDGGLFGHGDAEEVESAAVVRAALDRLIRRLRRSGLSEAEATDELVTHGVERVVAQVLVLELVGRRWLGDADLAEQLVHTAVSRRREGRRAIAQLLAKRRIPREVADAALAVLPDDDAERALEYARQKAGGMRTVPADVAIRRLAGQLQRRGYPSHVALTAARLAVLD